MQQQGTRFGLIVNVVELVKHVTTVPLHLPTKSKRALQGRARRMERRRQKTALLIQNIKRELKK